jgi:hypothetical protein
MCAFCGCQAIPAHIRTEQDGLSPAALLSLSTHDWDGLDRVRRRVAHDTEGSSAC